MITYTKIYLRKNIKGSKLMIEVAVLGVGGVKLLYNLEKIKSIQTNLDESTKRKILEEGIYHITTKENAENIVKSGFIMPSKGAVNNHFSKSKNGSSFADYVYMFAGKPDKFLLNKNLSHIIDSKSDGTFYAVKHTPDKYEIENYTKRLQDGAVTYEGRLDIKNSNPQIVRLKLEKGKVVEIPLDKKVKKDSKKVEIFKRIKGKSASILATAAELKQAGMIYFDKERKSKLKECIANRKLENKLLRQYNLEKARKTFYMEHDNKKYEISTENDKFVDGRILSEFNLYDVEKDESKKIYTDRLDVSSISKEKLVEFFETTIDYDLDNSQYIGSPEVVDGNLMVKKDEEFSKHFIAKQELKKENDIKSEEILKREERAKKQLGIFKKIYEKTSIQTKIKAIQSIKNIRNRKKERNEEIEF